MPGRYSTSTTTMSPVQKRASRPPAKNRQFSASEIARNAKHFETWCSYQRSEQVDFSDIPNDLKEDVDCVFATNGRLPASWTDTSSKSHKRLKRCFPEALVNMILGAHKLCPELFSDEVASKDSWPLLSQLETVSGAWVRLQKLRGSNQKISEADFVANVYETIRSRPMEQSDYRSKCSIALPQPLRPVASGSEAVRILGAKTVIPDCAIFIPAANILELSHTSRSPFKKLKRTSLTGCGDSGDKSFGSQSTPCTQLQAMPGFEFASSFWEDKKPVHSILEDAYRQNRMSTTAAVRQLHSLHVKAPVFGLVWSDGNVRAHVDWCLSEGEKLIIQSAPYPGYNRTTQSATPIFHEWRLDRPADIIQVFLLIRNIDIWTVGRFNERVKAGVKELVDAVLVRKQSYRPWKRVGSVVSTLRGPLADENVNTSSQPNSSAEVKPKSKGRRRRS